jgi:hypothetical protein
MLNDGAMRTETQFVKGEKREREQVKKEETSYRDPRWVNGNHVF